MGAPTLAARWSSGPQLRSVLRIVAALIFGRRARSSSSDSIGSRRTGASPLPVPDRMAGSWRSWARAPGPGPFTSPSRPHVWDDGGRVLPVRTSRRLLPVNGGTTAAIYCFVWLHSTSGPAVEPGRAEEERVRAPSNLDAFPVLVHPLEAAKALPRLRGRLRRRGRARPQGHTRDGRRQSVACPGGRPALPRVLLRRSRRRQDRTPQGAGWGPP